MQTKQIFTNYWKTELLCLSVCLQCLPMSLNVYQCPPMVHQLQLQLTLWVSWNLSLLKEIMTGFSIWIVVMPVMQLFLHCYLCLRRWLQQVHLWHADRWQGWWAWHWEPVGSGESSPGTGLKTPPEIGTIPIPILKLDWTGLGSILFYLILI